MAPPQADDRTLRSINYRLKNTSTGHLPKILGPITSQLVSSKCNLSASNQETTWLKTRITALLQDRSPEARFAAVVLVKTVLDLSDANAVVQDKDRIATWIRGLLDVLKKPGSTSTTRKCAVVALTKVFMLTWENATLVRELTTPSLPTFIAASLQLLHGKPAQNEIWEYVLGSFAQLLPRHPTIFRSYASQMRNLAIEALCNDPFDDGVTSIVGSTETKDAAARVIVLLHQCAQKGGGAAEWEKGIDELIVTCHATLDQAFRAVTEEWQSVAGVRSTVTASEELPDEPNAEVDEKVGFPSWSGLRSGVLRVQSLLSLLQAYIYTPTATSVKMPLGRIIDLLTRVLYVQVPRSKDALGVRYNAQIAREEREELLSLLPGIHVSTIEAIGILLERLDNTSLPVCGQLLDLITWLFEAEAFDTDIRTAVYRSSAQLLSITGPTLRKPTLKSLDKIIRACCKDLLPATEDSKSKPTEVINTQLTNGSKPGKVANGTNTSSIVRHSLAETLPGLYSAAYDLLPIFYFKLPTELLSTATRAQMDRTSILTNHTDALAVSVLNPAPQKPSLLPFLAATAPGNAVTEAILRPRVPVILTGRHDEVRTEEDDQEMGDEYVELEANEHEEDQAIEEPTTTDWAAVSRVEPKEPVSSTSFGNIAATQLDVPVGKRSVEEEEEVSTTGVKRARREDVYIPAEPFVPVTEEAIPQTEIAPLQVAPDSTAAVEESDDEDGSDFEMPKLFLKTADEEDDVEED